MKEIEENKFTESEKLHLENEQLKGNISHLERVVGQLYMQVSSLLKVIEAFKNKS